MKLQYLGDSKDAFKWDYHDHLATSLGVPVLTVVPMLTHDDGGGHGNTRPEDYPVERIWAFCNKLRSDRKLGHLTELPRFTGASYSVVLHKPAIHFTNENRRGYFGRFASESRQLVFADPDNGFEPERRFSEKHLCYAEVASLLDQLSEDSVLSVFHHFRRIRFTEDFARIRERLVGLHSTAVYWHSLMFVAIGKSADAVAKVADTNRRYAETHPVKVLP